MPESWVNSNGIRKLEPKGWVWANIWPWLILGIIVLCSDVLRAAIQDHVGFRNLSQWCWQCSCRTWNSILLSLAFFFSLLNCVSNHKNHTNKGRNSALSCYQKRQPFLLYSISVLFVKQFWRVFQHWFLFLLGERVFGFSLCWPKGAGFEVVVFIFRFGIGKGNNKDLCNKTPPFPWARLSLMRRARPFKTNPMRRALL